MKPQDGADVHDSPLFRSRNWAEYSTEARGTLSFAIAGNPSLGSSGKHFLFVIFRSANAGNKARLSSQKY